MIRVMGVFLLIPATMILAVSFFTFLGACKADCRPMKIFGRMVGSLLVLCSLMVLGVGAYIAVTGRHPVIGLLHELLKQWAAK